MYWASEEGGYSNYSVSSMCLHAKLSIVFGTASRKEFSVVFLHLERFFSINLKVFFFGLF